MALSNSSEASQKVNHNKMERKRRDKIKQSYLALKNSIKVKSNTSRVDTLKAAIAYLDDMKERKKRLDEKIKEKKSQRKRLREKLIAKGLQNKISLHDMEDESEDSDFETNENMKKSD